MEYCKAKFFRKIALILGMVFMLNSVLFVQSAVAKAEIEKQESNATIMLLGQKVGICGGKSVSIEKYIDLFNSKHFNDGFKHANIKNPELADTSFQFHALGSFFGKDRFIISYESSGFENQPFKAGNPRSPPFAA